MVAVATGLESLRDEDLTTNEQGICAGLERIDGRSRTPEELVQELQG